MFLNTARTHLLSVSLLLCLSALTGCTLQKNPPAPKAEATPQTMVPLPTKQELLAQAEENIRRELSVMGYAEHIAIKGVDAPISARLDTGATTSSLGVKIIREFERDGEDYVLFRVDAADESPDTAEKTFEAQIERWVRIVKKEGGYIRRPVVKLTVCLGSHLTTQEFNLADREHFTYAALVGRNVLAKNNIIVDSRDKKQTTPTCPELKATTPAPAAED